MKKAITVLSYCDTTEKKEILKSLISRLKILYPEHAVLVYSHYSGVECEYYQQADYYIYDYSNPPSTRNFFDWSYIPQINLTFYRQGGDFGLAVVQMIKRSALFLDSIGIESSLYINYDMNIDQEESLKLIEISEHLIDHVGILPKWGEGQFALCYFWLNIKAIGREFFNSITSEKYLSYDTSFIAEKIFYEIMTEGLGNKCLSLNIHLNGKISGISREVESGADIKKHFSTMVASTSKVDGSKVIAIWKSNIMIERLSVEIDGKEYLLINVLENKWFFLANLPQEEISEIRILKVNDEIVEPYKMSLDWEKNTHHENLP